MLDAWVRSSENDLWGFLQIFDPETETHFLHKPFRRQAVSKVLPLDARRLVCLGEESSLAILEGRTGNHLHSRSVREHFSSGSQVKDMVRLPSHNAVALMGNRELLIVDDTDLSIRFSANAALWDGPTGILKNTREMSETEKFKIYPASSTTSQSVETDDPYLDRLYFADFIRERPDGLVVTGSYINEIYEERSLCNPTDLAKRSGFYTIDIRERSIAHSEIDKCYDYYFHNNFLSADPSGRWAIRNSFRQISHHKISAAARPVLKLFGKRSQFRHPDLKSDGIDRFLMRLELWDLESGRFVRELDVFWKEIPDSNMAKRWIAAGNMLTELKQPFYRYKDGLIHPPGWRFEKFFKDLSEEFRKEYQFWQSTWETSGDALWLTHKEGLRRISVDGHISPLIRFETPSRPKGTSSRGPWNEHLIEVLKYETEFLVRNESCTLHIPKAAVSRDSHEVWISEEEARVKIILENAGRDLAPQETRHLSGHLVKLSNLSETAARSSLNKLTEDILDRFPEILGGSKHSPSFEVFFQNPEKTLSEADFFELAIRDGWRLQNETRKLLQAWLDQLERMDLGSSCYTHVSSGIDPETGYHVGGLGQALKYLVLFDDKCLEIFRTYLSRRDGEHEFFSADILSRVYINLHGYCSPEVYRFYIFWVATRYSDGRRPVENLWNELGLLDAASASMLPSSFAEMVITELDIFNAKWSSSDQAVGDVLDGLKKLLHSKGDWAEQLLLEIAQRDFDGSRREYRSPFHVPS